MVKRKIGILVFTNLINKRGTRKNLYFDSERYNGFRYIISEINRERNEVIYISRKQIKDCDYVLVSITSYMDIQNLVNELENIDKGYAKIIIGGAGVTNIRLYRHLIDYACFGRGEYCINRILNDDIPDNVWSKKDDPNLEKKYRIGECKKLIEGERSVGCINKCYFCQYSWKNKYCSGDNNISYQSGYSRNEDIFNALNWEKAKRTAVTALDGINEYARKRINKNMTKEEIIDKIKEAYKIKTDKRLSLKVYMIIGYPWEDRDSANLIELKKVLKSADKEEKTHSIIFMFNFTHFVPMQLTPMYNMPLNFINFRSELNIKRNYMIYKGNNIKAYINSYTTTPAAAFDELYIERAFEKDYDDYIKIFNTKKYQSLSVDSKINVIKKYANPELYEKNNNISVDYLIPNYNYEVVKING
jgi:radical SAM superfamily enzyme YgiQ (UPF0313 family)